MDDRCAVPRCRREVEIIYLGHGVCSVCWDRFTAEDVPFERLRMVLGVERATPTAMEVEMSESKRKGTKKAKAPAEAKPKKERPPKEASRVFAIRVTDQELAAIHKAAGPRNATRFIRQVAAAFASEDEAAFRAVVKEAKEARQ